MFALSDENGVHIMRQCYRVRMLKFNLRTVVGLANTVMSHQVPLTVDGFCFSMSGLLKRDSAKMSQS